MSSTTFTVRTSLSPHEVMALMTDFGPSRVANWPNIDEAHFEVHETGPDWAEVTEGTAMGWERERYSWDAAAGTIAIETLDSNLWGPGSGWRYRLTPAGDGTDVQVTLTRVPKSIAARVLAALIPVVGGRTLGKQLESVFGRPSPADVGLALTRGWFALSGARETVSVSSKRHREEPS